MLSTVINTSATVYFKIDSQTTGSTNCRRLSTISENCCSKLKMWPAYTQKSTKQLPHKILMTT